MQKPLGINAPRTTEKNPNMRHHSSALMDLSDFPESIKAKMIETAPGIRSGIEKGTIFPSSVAYMLYWYGRFKREPVKQAEISSTLQGYLKSAGVSPISTIEGNTKSGTNGMLGLTDDGWKKGYNVTTQLSSDQELIGQCTEYVEISMRTRKMVDLYITRGEKSRNTDSTLEFGIYERPNFPTGSALPGGIILDSDEQNPYGFSENIYAVLRVGATKVLEIGEDEAIFEYDSAGGFYKVRTQDNKRGLILSARDIRGVYYRDDLSKITEPSSPLHMVESTGFHMRYYGDIPSLKFLPSSESTTLSKNRLVFSHHRKLIWGLTAKTEEHLSNDQDHHAFIRELIEKPEDVYANLHTRFASTNYATNTPMPELLPVIRYLEGALFSERINKHCKQNKAFMGMRDQVYNTLHHLHLSNRPLCPYMASIIAIEKAIEFFDTIIRIEIGFYNHDSMPSDKPIVHNPGTIPHARYHEYKYHYRFTDYFHNPEFRGEIMMPTFVHVGATDLMRIRGIPIRIVGISIDLLYVDEFEQASAEFWGHDLNHCRRYALEDRKVATEMGISLEELYRRSSADAREYMKNIIINPSDSPEDKAKKRIKKIILFEVVHEDARVFLKDTIVNTLLRMEGEDVPFEWRSHDPETKEGAVVDIQEQYIHTLAYVRYKLQKGFYDTFEDKKGYIADRDYRYSRKIAEIAREMLIELSKPLELEKYSHIELCEDGYPSIKWLMERIWSIGPPEIHDKEFFDPDKAKYYIGHNAATTREYDI